MSICKICAANGKPGVEITWSEKVKSAHTGKLIPLETDGSTFHKHYEPTATNESPTPAAAKTITSTDPEAGAKWIRSIISDNKQEDPALEALTLEFRTLLKHMISYLRTESNK